MNRNVIYTIIFLLSLTTAIPSIAVSKKLPAGKVVFDTVPFSLAEQAQSAEYIFRGRVKEVTSEIVQGLPCKKVQFSIGNSDWIKGKEKWIKSGSSPKLFVAKMWTPLYRNIPVIENGEVIVAFNGISKAGLTAPISIDQGYYNVYQDETSTFVNRQVAINNQKNANLVTSILSGRVIELENKDLKNRIIENSKNGKPILATDLVEAFIELSGGKD